MTSYSNLKTWMDNHYGGSSAEATVTCKGKTYTGHMYGNDECFDTNGFYQYFLTAEELLKMYYDIPEEYNDFGAIDYSAPYDVRVDDAQYWVDYVI